MNSTGRGDGVDSRGDGVDSRGDRLWDSGGRRYLVRSGRDRRRRIVVEQYAYILNTVMVGGCAR